MRNVDIKELENRSGRYWNLDGLPELVMGFLWASWGIAFLVPDLLPKGGWTSLYWSIVPLLLAGSGFAGAWLTKRLKERWTFPRAGYVELKEPKVEHLLAAALMGFVVAGAIGLWMAFTKLANRGDLAAPAVGVLFAASLVFAGRRFHLPQYTWLAAIALASGIALYPFSLGMSGISWLLLILGCAMAAAGGRRLHGFLKSHPLEVQS